MTKNIFERKCPICGSTYVKTERRPDGDSECVDCKHKANTEEFTVCINQENRPPYDITPEEAKNSIEDLVGSLITDKEHFYNTPHDIFSGKTLQQYIDANPRGAVGAIMRMAL